MAVRIAVSVGRGFQSSRAFALINMPGVQKPQWTASWSRNDSCKGWSLLFCARPSMVMTSRPSIWGARTKQELTASPSSRIVQAPHSPISQPHFVPGRPMSSRSNSSSVRLARVVKVCERPLIVVVMRHSRDAFASRLGDWESRAARPACPLFEYTFAEWAGETHCPTLEAHCFRARVTSTAMTGSLYSVDQRRPVALIISSETFCPAAANSFAAGFSPMSICSASVTRCQIGKAAPGTIRASIIVPSSPIWRMAATLNREIERALRRPSLIKVLRVFGGSLLNWMTVRSSPGLAAVW